MKLFGIVLAAVGFYVCPEISSAGESQAWLSCSRGDAVIAEFSQPEGVLPRDLSTMQAEHNGVRFQVADYFPGIGTKSTGLLLRGIQNPNDIMILEFANRYGYQSIGLKKSFKGSVSIVTTSEVRKYLVECKQALN